MRYKNTLISVIVLLIIVTLIESASDRQAPIKKAQKEKEEIFFALSPLEAKAIYVYDLGRDKVLYEKNADLALPLASLAKLMTAFVALKEAPKGTLITIDGESLAKEGDTGLILGEKWTLKKLVEFTLTTSSNDGAAAIALAFNSKRENTNAKSKTFVERMNEEALKLGLSHTRFLNETGLDEAQSKVGAYGSARDISALLGEFLKQYPEILEATTYAIQSIYSENKIHNIENTNKETSKIPGLMASKTGFTDIAGGNLIIAFDAGLGQPIIITVLGSTQEGRFSDMETLAERAREAIRQGM
ncbi:MAG: serine hydrolase [Patescibacteria group bacterium]